MSHKQTTEREQAGGACLQPAATSDQIRIFLATVTADSEGVLVELSRG